MTHWTQEQIEHLNRIQRGESQEAQEAQVVPLIREYDLPRTCPNRSITPHHHNGADFGRLLAIREGWLCPDCGYTEAGFSDGHREPLSNADVLALGA